MEISKVYKVAILLNNLQIVFEESVKRNTEFLEDGVTEKCTVNETVWRNPMVINVVPTKNGQEIFFSPTCKFGDNSFIKPISEDKIMVIYDLGDNLKGSYEKVVQQLSAQKSGIEIVPAGAIPKTKNVTQHPHLKNVKRRR